jgi:hypothetical protein
MTPTTTPSASPAGEAIRTTAAMCVDCGTKVTGPYCFECGAASGRVTCRHCGGATRPDARFCTSCGGRAAPRWRTRDLAKMVPWLLGATLIGVLAVAFLRPAASATSVAAQGLDAPATAGTPPDLSAMSPRERFDRLYTRIIEAAQRGDQATVERFTPMAVGAFQALDTVDADARYHLAMLQLHVGGLNGARAQADSIIALTPDHLFGYVIGAAVARWSGDEAVQRGMYRKFNSRYAAEIAASRPEYVDHRAMLIEVKKMADSLGR